MPMYDYRCENCGEIFEELVFSSNVPDEEIECPVCHEYVAKKLLSAPSISVGGSSSFGGGGNCGGGSGFS